MGPARHGSAPDTVQVVESDGEDLDVSRLRPGVRRLPAATPSPGHLERIERLGRLLADGWRRTADPADAPVQGLPRAVAEALQEQRDWLGDQIEALPARVGPVLAAELGARLAEAVADGLVASAIEGGPLGLEVEPTPISQEALDQLIANRGHHFEPASPAEPSALEERLESRLEALATRLYETARARYEVVSEHQEDLEARLENLADRLDEVLSSVTSAEAGAVASAASVASVATAVAASNPQVWRAEVAELGERLDRMDESLRDTAQLVRDTAAASHEDATSRAQELEDRLEALAERLYEVTRARHETLTGRQEELERRLVRLADRAEQPVTEGQPIDAQDVLDQILSADRARQVELDGLRQHLEEMQAASDRDRERLHASLDELIKELVALRRRIPVRATQAPPAPAIGRDQPKPRRAPRSTG